MLLSTGSKDAAAHGELMFLVGGDSADVEACGALLACMGSRIVHVGGHGLGSALKMVNNLLGAVAMAAFAEGTALGQALGVPRQTIFDTLIGGPMVAPLLAAKRGKIEREDYDPEFSTAMDPEGSAPGVDQRLRSRRGDAGGQCHEGALPARDAARIRRSRLLLPLRLREQHRQRRCGSQAGAGGSRRRRDAVTKAAGKRTDIPDFRETHPVIRLTMDGVAREARPGERLVDAITRRDRDSARLLPPAARPDPDLRHVHGRGERKARARLRDGRVADGMIVTTASRRGERRAARGVRPHPRATTCSTARSATTTTATAPSTTRRSCWRSSISRSRSSPSRTRSTTPTRSTATIPTSASSAAAASRRARTWR